MKKIGFSEFSLLGWSDGGISGMILSAKYDKVVKKLIIWGSNAYVIEEELKIYEKIRDISNWSPKMKEPLVKLYGESGFQKLWNDWCDTLKNIHEKKGGDICKNKLQLIKCPTLILHGAKDPMIAKEHPLFLQKHIQNSRYLMKC